MTFKGEVRRIALVSKNNAEEFYLRLREQLETFGDLYIEVQYQTTMQPDGAALFSALIIGRSRQDD